ncbi:MAG: Slp family lipoprotein [Nitrospirota bacterium]|jgi:outer membrane lipoprotein
MTRYGFSGRLFLLVSALVFILSCAPPISKRYREEAAPNVTFTMVLEDPAAFKGSLVVWGGVIIKTVVLDGGTELFILETPLGWREKPGDADSSQGRFIAISSSYLDPLIYHRGRKVTLAGEVTGERTTASPKTQRSYTYPVVTVKELHLWQKERAYYPYYYGWYPPFNWGCGPFGDEFCGDYFGGEEFEGGEEHRGEREYRDENERGGEHERGEERR